MLKPTLLSLEKCTSRLKEKIHFLYQFVFILNIIEKNQLTVSE